MPVYCAPTGRGRRTSYHPWGVLGAVERLNPPADMMSGAAVPAGWRRERATQWEPWAMLPALQETMTGERCKRTPILRR